MGLWKKCGLSDNLLEKYVKEGLNINVNKIRLSVGTSNLEVTHRQLIVKSDLCTKYAHFHSNYSHSTYSECSHDQKLILDG